MKAVLEFNLPEDQSDFDMAKNGSEYYCVLSDVLNYLRCKLKYESNNSNDYEKGLSFAREQILKELEERNLFVD